MDQNSLVLHVPCGSKQTIIPFALQGVFGTNNWITKKKKYDVSLQQIYIKLH